MRDVLTFGNAACDVLLKSSSFNVVKDVHSPTGSSHVFANGAKIPIDWQMMSVGGGAVNTAVTFARQGFSTGIVSHIGNDVTGQHILQHVTAEGIHAEHLHIVAGAHSAYSTIFLTETGERTILAYRGDFPPKILEDLPTQDLLAGWFYITSLDGDLKLLKKLFEHAKAQRTKIALNPGILELKQPALKKLLIDVDVLIMNHEEANYLLSEKEAGRNRLQAIAEMTQATVVITNGARGAAVFDGRKEYFMHAQAEKSINRIGAGDAFGSGFVAGLLRFNGNVVAAMQLANANAAAVCLQYGANTGILKATDHYKLGTVSEYQL